MEPAGVERHRRASPRRLTSGKPRNFFAELKRRNVYKVAVAYAVDGWALAQSIAQVLPVFDIPNWAARLIVLAIVIAWAF